MITHDDERHHILNNALSAMPGLRALTLEQYQAMFAGCLRIIETAIKAPETHEYSVVLYDSIDESGTDPIEVVAENPAEAARVAYGQQYEDIDRCTAEVTGKDGVRTVLECTATRDCETEVVDMDPPVHRLPPEHARKVPNKRVKRAGAHAYVRDGEGTVRGKWPDGVEGIILACKDWVRDYTTEGPGSWSLGRATYRQLEIQLGAVKVVWVSSYDADLVEDDGATVDPCRP